jgi:hypothetical protein
VLRTAPLLSFAAFAVGSVARCINASAVWHCCAFKKCTSSLPVTVLTQIKSKRMPQGPYLLLPKKIFTPENIEQSDDELKGEMITIPPPMYIRVLVVGDVPGGFFTEDTFCDFFFLAFFY